MEAYQDTIFLGVGWGGGGGFGNLKRPSIFFFFLQNCELYLSTMIYYYSFSISLCVLFYYMCFWHHKVNKHCFIVPYGSEITAFHYATDHFVIIVFVSRFSEIHITLAFGVTGKCYWGWWMEGKLSIFLWFMIWFIHYLDCSHQYIC